DGRRVGRSPVLEWTAREPGCRVDASRSGVRTAPAHLAGKGGEDFHRKGELGALVEIRRNQTLPGAAPQTGWCEPGLLAGVPRASPSLPRLGRPLRRATPSPR